MPRALGAVLAALVVFTTGQPIAAQERPTPGPHTTWRDYGGGADSSKFVALDQITKTNVKQLQVAWTYFEGAAVMNPVVVDDVAYV